MLELKESPEVIGALLVDFCRIGLQPTASALVVLLTEHKSKPSQNTAAKINDIVDRGLRYVIWFDSQRSLGMC